MAGNRLALKITGLRELSLAVDNYGRAVVADAQRAMAEAVEGTVADARAAAPVATGALRDSIRGKITVDPYGAVGEVRATVYYASFLEFGTEDTDKHPFLLSAAIRHQERLVAAQKASVVSRAPAGLGQPTISGDTGLTPRVGSNE